MNIGDYWASIVRYRGGSGSGSGGAVEAIESWLPSLRKIWMVIPFLAQVF